MGGAGELVNRQCGEGEDTTFAAVIRPHDDADVLNSNHQDERPGNGGEDAVNIGGADDDTCGVEALAQRIEGEVPMSPNTTPKAATNMVVLEAWGWWGLVFMLED